MSKLKILSFVMLFIASSLTFSSCSDDDEPKVDNSKTTYIIKSDLGIDKMAAEYGVVPIVTLVSLEYNDKDELINTQTWENVKDGNNKMFDANERCVKIVIRIELRVNANGSHRDFVRYVSIVNYLNLNENTFILLDGNTRVSLYNPIQ